MKTLTIQIDSKKLGHAVGIALSAIYFVAGDQAFIASLPEGVRPFLHTFLSLVPWFTMMGINVGTNPPPSA